MRTPIPALVAAVAFVACAVISVLFFGAILPCVGLLLLAAVTFASAKICLPWEQAVVVRLGKYQGTRKPGIFYLIPGIDSVLDYVDSRIQSKDIKAERISGK